MKGLLINTDNQIGIRDFEEPLYKTVGSAVGGYIEIVHAVHLESPFVMIVNEEGLLDELQLNNVGSILYGMPDHGQPIVGNIVIMAEGETDEGMDIIGIPEDQIESVYERFKSTFELTEMKGENE